MSDVNQSDNILFDALSKKTNSWTVILTRQFHLELI